MKKIIIGIFVFLMIVSVAIATPVFVSPSNYELFVVNQSEHFEYTILVSDNPANFPINITTTAHDNNIKFDCFSKIDLNETASLINFTPENDCVGYYMFSIIATNSNITPNTETFTIYFNITNQNDYPWIVNTTPENFSSVLENGSLYLDTLADDLDLIYGDLLNFSWFLDGFLSPKLVGTTTNASFAWCNYTPAVEDFDAGIHNLTVEVKDQDNLSVNYTWNINVTNVNRPPIFTPSINNFSWFEDTNLTDILNVSDYFVDLDTNGTDCEIDTGFCIEYGSDVTENLTVSFNGSKVSFIPNPDWFGIINARISAFDNYETIWSNTFVLNVSNVNDLPDIDSIENQSMYANTDFLYGVIASDKDEDNLTYLASCPTISTVWINPVTGLLNFSVDSSESGNHSVNITVLDGIGSSTIFFNLEVKANERPTILPISNISMFQYDNIVINVSASDDGSDDLTFSSSYEPLNPGSRSSATSWNFSYNPTSQFSIGNHTVFIIAEDSRGSKGKVNFTLEIKDTPMPPQIGDINVPNGEIKINKLLNLSVSAFDEDGDIVSFYDNTTLFDITTEYEGSITEEAEGIIDFTPVVLGDYYVNISVNDSNPFENSTIFHFEVVSNTAPEFIGVANMTCEENDPCTLQINASDHDWQDSLMFDHNDTGEFYIDPNTGFINFTPNSNESFFVTINVTDGEDVASAEIYVNITIINDPPYFITDLEDLLNNVIENTTSELYLYGEDEENDTMTLEVSFINFTDLSGATHILGIDLFDFSEIINLSDNTIRGYLNFKPNSSEVGEYWVNFTIKDSLSATSEVFPFVVENLNNPPEVLSWEINYYGTNVSSFLDPNYPEPLEGETLEIKVDFNDQDFDNVSWNWKVEGFMDYSYDGSFSTYPYSQAAINITLPFLTAPNSNITLMLKDSFNASLNYSFPFNITNVNRDIVFGKKNVPFEGTFNDLIVRDGKLELDMNGSVYALTGEFISDRLDFESTTAAGRTKYGKIIEEGSATLYDYSLWTGTSNLDNEIKPPWDETTIYGDITSNDYRYLYLKVQMETEDNTTPSINSLDITYNIKNISVGADTTFEPWLDLDNFFKDKDLDDILTYNYTIISGENLINVTMTDNLVSISFISKGEAELQFTANDNQGSTAQSNVVVITIGGDSEETPKESRSSSGGGVTKYTEYKYKVITEPISIDLIHPTNVTFYENQTIKIPITLKNSDEFDLTGVTLTAESNRDVPLSFSTDFFSFIPKDGIEELILTLNATKIYDSYEIILHVNVSDPAYEDSSRFLISSLKRLKESEQEQKLKLSFVHDLLQSNEECGELKEYIVRAKELFKVGSIEEGNQLLDLFVNDCKELTKVRPELERPSTIINSVVEKAKGDMEYRIVLFTIVGLVALTIIALLIMVYRKV